MTKHDEERIGPILSVLRCTCPSALIETLQTGNEPLAVFGEMLKRRFEIHLQEEIVRVLLAGQIRPNDWCGIAEHEIKTIEEERMHVREMTRVFMRGPSPRRWAAFEDV